MTILKLVLAIILVLLGMFFITSIDYINLGMRINDYSWKINDKLRIILFGNCIWKYINYIRVKYRIKHRSKNVNRKFVDSVLKYNAVTKNQHEKLLNMLNEKVK